VIATGTTQDVGRLLRELAPQVLGALARRHRDFAAAEDAVQEAMLAAVQQWPGEGVPANPRGWLYHVATRRLTDQLRSERARRRREERVVGEVLAEWAFVPPPDGEVDVARDDSLVLLVMCCHPALTDASAIALTLRAVGGLTTAEIARAFFVPEATMAQRISRAKQSIRTSGVPFAMPGDDERADRLRAVLHVLYLIFNEGYASSAGESVHRAELADEAIRLARLLYAALPHDGEVAGLLALMLLTDARRAARVDEYGGLVPLDRQDRSRWNRPAIAEGVALVESAMRRGAVGPYQLQAAIAALHDEAPSTDATDWPQILALYGVLARIADNPIVTLNRAIATAMVHGAQAGLAMLAPLDADDRVTRHHRLDAVRGYLLERAGDLRRAVVHYRSAAERTASIPERNHLLTKAASLESELRAQERAS